MLFTQRMESLTRQKIRSYIQTALQNEIEQIAITGIAPGSEASPSASNPESDIPDIDELDAAN
jgi:hypothetical protein